MRKILILFVLSFFLMSCWNEDIMLDEKNKAIKLSDKEKVDKYYEEWYKYYEEWYKLIELWRHDEASKLM